MGSVEGSSSSSSNSMFVQESQQNCSVPNIGAMFMMSALGVLENKAQEAHNS